MQVGGSYSRYTGGSVLARGLTIEGDLVDSSGRKINTGLSGTNGLEPGLGRTSRLASPGPTTRK